MKHRPLALFLAAVFVGAGFIGMFNEDLSTVFAFISIAALIAAVVVMPAVRQVLADRFPPVRWLGRRIMALRWRTIGLVFAGCVVALFAAEWIEDALEPPGKLADHLVTTYGEDLRDDRPPLTVAAELEDEFPADDQRYTGVGVILRYEDAVVAVRPDGGGTVIERYGEDEGYRRFYAYVGDFWGETYHEKDPGPRSRLTVPDEDDVEALRGRLGAAQRAQGVCYTWDVMIESGRREGPFQGPDVLDECPQVRLVGSVDPNANPLSRGSSGDWELTYEWTVDGEIRQASVDAVDTPMVEMLEGATQQPRGDGVRAGKGLIEHIEVMPLLAQDIPEVPRVDPEPRASPPADARPAEVERTDGERRAEDSFAAFPPAIIRVGAIFTLGFLVIGLIVAGIARLVRRVRAPG